MNAIKVMGTTLAIAIAIAGLVLVGRPISKSLVKMWIEPEFSTVVSDSATKLIRGSELCIYDDQRDILVAEFSDLDTSKMLEAAVNDNYPKFFSGRPTREPHFRIFANATTYYWSFREQKFLVSPNVHWSLDDRLLQLCRSFRSNPVKMKEAISGRYGIETTEENYCCKLIETQLQPR